MQAATGLADIELSALPMDGDYVIAVEGRIDNTASAAFTARVIEIGETARAIGIGAPVGGHIAAGQPERLTFTPASSARLVFDRLTSNGTLLWSLTGPRRPDGTSRRFHRSDSADYDFNESLLPHLPPGAYAL